MALAARKCQLVEEDQSEQQDDRSRSRRPAEGQQCDGWRGARVNKRFMNVPRRRGGGSGLGQPPGEPVGSWSDISKYGLVQGCGCEDVADAGLDRPHLAGKEGWPQPPLAAFRMAGAGAAGLPDGRPGPSTRTARVRGVEIQARPVSRSRRGTTVRAEGPPGAAGRTGWAASCRWRTPAAGTVPVVGKPTMACTHGSPGVDGHPDLLRRRAEQVGPPPMPRAGCGVAESMVILGPLFQVLGWLSRLGHGGPADPVHVQSPEGAAAGGDAHLAHLPPGRRAEPAGWCRAACSGRNRPAAVRRRKGFRACM